jgi:hypothetical protein
MTASYGLTLREAGRRMVMEDLGRWYGRSFDAVAAFAEAVIPLVGGSGRAESPPQPSSFTGDRRVG